MTTTMMVQCMALSSVVLGALLPLPQVEAGSIEFKSIDSLFGGGFVAQRASSTNGTLLQHGPTREERELERKERKQRQRERNTRVKEALKNVQLDSAERVSETELRAMGDDHPFLRQLGWGRNSNKGNAIEFLDPGQDYDMWSQAYRMLGGFIDCDHKKDQNGESHDGEGGGDDGDGKGCSRWMMWASYVDPYYEGGEYYEYHGDNPTGALDCHAPDTHWQLLGVYRQEFYQFIEQISKHVWAIDDYEYVVALAGLAYMTDEDCYYVGKSDDGTYIYAGVAPQPYGEFVIALYTDEYCLNPNDELGITFDDYQLYSDVQLASGDGDDGNGYSYAYEWWQDTQEYTLTLLNEVYDEFRYCTSCIDYPTYQDGYLIGDTGTDDDDVINQCWKFYSHDSFTCDADCIALGHSQGTILPITVAGTTYGKAVNGYYATSTGDAELATATVSEESKFSKLLANAFVTFSFIVFVATFLAFAVARRSRYRESRSSKSRRLLDDEDDYGKSPRSRRSTRSKSKTRDADEGDGLFRTSSRKSRSKSGSKRDRHKSSRSRSHGRKEEEYDPPKSSRSRSKPKRSGSKSRRQHIDDF